MPCEWPATKLAPKSYNMYANRKWPKRKQRIGLNTFQTSFEPRSVLRLSLKAGLSLIYLTQLVVNLTHSCDCYLLYCCFPRFPLVDEIVAAVVVLAVAL